MKDTVKKVLRITGIIIIAVPLLYIAVNGIIFLLAAHSLGESNKKQQDRYSSYVDEHTPEFSALAEELEGYILNISEENRVPADEVEIFLKYEYKDGWKNTAVNVRSKSEGDALAVPNDIMKKLKNMLEERNCDIIRAEKGEIHITEIRGTITCKRNEQNEWECTGFAHIHGWE